MQTLITPFNSKFWTRASGCLFGVKTKIDAFDAVTHTLVAFDPSNLQKLWKERAIGDTAWLYSGDKTVGIICPGVTSLRYLDPQTGAAQRAVALPDDLHFCPFAPPLHVLGENQVFYSTGTLGKTKLVSGRILDHTITVDGTTEEPDGYRCGIGNYILYRHPFSPVATLFNSKLQSRRFVTGGDISALKERIYVVESDYPSSTIVSYPDFEAKKPDLQIKMNGLITRIGHVFSNGTLFLVGHPFGGAFVLPNEKHDHFTTFPVKDHAFCSDRLVYVLDNHSKSVTEHTPDGGKKNISFVEVANRIISVCGNLIVLSH